MSQPCGGLSSDDACQLVTFPQVRAFSNVGLCRGELTGLELFVPTLCPPGSTPSRYRRLSIRADCAMVAVARVATIGNAGHMIRS